MLGLPNSRNFIIIKEEKELKLAKDNDICRYIIKEEGNIIYIWERNGFSWNKRKYVAHGEGKDRDTETAGLKAYTEFYKWCGKDNVERMKKVLREIEPWESYEQQHYYNWEYAKTKIYKDIYVFDANSAFTYGVYQLPDDFKPLKEYMRTLYEKKANAKTKIVRSRFKNLQVFLIGYFSRVKGLVSVRSEVIRLSNLNITQKMIEIRENGGTVYLSNTDSIVTDSKGAEVMEKYLGDDAGQFKLEKVCSRLYYLSSNCYQLDDKVTYSGVKYFSRINMDFFNDIFARQFGSLVEGYDFEIESSDGEYSKICRIKAGTITVEIFDILGNVVSEKKYTIRE